MTDTPIEPRMATIDITASIDLSEAEIFPDGAAEGWTAEDVAQVMRSEGSVSTLLSAWNLTPCLDVTVTDDEGNSAEVTR